jgi:hypothetical protein
MTTCMGCTISSDPGGLYHLAIRTIVTRCLGNPEGESVGHVRADLLCVGGHTTHDARRSVPQHATCELNDPSTRRIEDTHTDEMSELEPSSNHTEDD